MAGALGGVAAIAALILLGAEFTTLFAVSTAASAGPVRSVMTGPHHDWALLPIALLSGILALMLWRRQDRSALLPLALLGAVTLVIALAIDLPAAQESGLLRVAGGGYQIGTAAPRIGMYLETLAAILLIIAGGAGLLLGPPSSRAVRSGSRED